MNRTLLLCPALLCGLLVLPGTGQAATGHATTGQATTVTRGGLTVTYREASDRPYVAQVFQLWQQAKADLRQKGLELPPTTLVAARNAADFAALSGAPANIAAVTVGHTIYTQRLGSLKAKNLLPLTLRHEAFHRAQPPDLPRWLAEGLARLFSGEAQNDPATSTGLEGLTGAELSARLSRWPEGQLNAAYLEATRRAGQLVSRQGWSKTLSAGP